MILQIAALCAINVGAMGMTVEKIDEAQLKCQQYYSKCVAGVDQEQSLRLCILDRKLEK